MTMVSASSSTTFCSAVTVVVTDKSRSAASSAASASRTSLAGQSNRAESPRAMDPHRGGRRFEGLVAGQASHPRTNRSKSPGNTRGIGHKAG